MSKETKNKLVPKLRFPEFINDGNWNSDSLNSIAELIDERAGTKQYTTMSVTSGVGLVSQKEKFGREIAGAQYKNYYVIQKWDFAYNKSATKLFPEGYIAILKDIDSAAVPNSIFTCFRTDKNKIHPPFLDYLFQDNFHGKWLRRFIEVGARAHGSLSIDSEILMKMAIVFPKPQEQQKIADCLSSLDDLIIAENQKLEAFKSNKKGLMQKLFPTEGGKVPKIRFPEFREAPEWDITTLSEIANRIEDKVGNQQLTTVSISAGIGFVSQAEKFNRDISGQQYKNYIVLNEGDFAYNKGNSKKFPQGCVYKLKEFKIAAVPNAFISFRFNSTVVADFYQGYFENNFHGKQLQKFITSGARMDGLLNISPIDFFSIKLPTPKNKKEQQKIADCLSSLDRLIASQIEKVESLKLHKKGLMQGLFPNVNLVSK